MDHDGLRVSPKVANHTRNAFVKIVSKGYTRLPFDHVRPQRVQEEAIGLSG